MPFVQGRKRRAEQTQEEPESSPEPATQRQRVSNNDSDDEEFAGSVVAATTQNNLEETVKKMIRLALACEYQRRPIRRADISDKVLGNNNRRFKDVFNETQLQLRTVFGMEIVELPAREKITLQQKRAAAKNASQQSRTATSWVLRSILPSQYRDPAILQAPAAPTAEEDSKYTAIYTLLVSLVSLSGGTLPDVKMERYLRRLNIEDDTPVAEYEKTEKLFKRLEKDGYLVKVKESTGSGEDAVHWVVGPRGKVEIGEDGVRGLTKTVWGEMDAAEEEELERRIKRSLGMAERASDRRVPVSQEGQKRRGRSGQDDMMDDEEHEEEDDQEVES